MLALYIFVTHLLQGDCDICAIQKLRGFAIYCIKYTARLSRLSITSLCTRFAPPCASSAIFQGVAEKTALRHNKATA